MIFPSYGGRFSYSPEMCAAIADAARAPWRGVRAAVPVPAGGMTVERVPELLGFYGTDVMLLIGGSLLLAGDRLLERTRAFVAAAGACGEANATAAATTTTGACVATGATAAPREVPR